MFIYSNKRGESMSKNQNTKEIYKTEEELTAGKYRTLAKFFPFSITLLIIMFFRSFIIILLSNNVVAFFLFFFIVYYVSRKSGNYAIREYEYLLKKGKICVNYKLLFYKDYFSVINSLSTQNIKYDDLKKVIETDECFYLLSENEKKINVVLDKRNCNSNLIEFVRNINKRVYISKIGNPKYKLVELVNSIEKEKPTILKTLYYLTIVTLISLPFILVFIYQSSVAILAIKNNWIYFLLLPIPFLCFVFGTIYNKRGIKCTKNIVLGIIVSLVIICLGSPSIEFNSQAKKDYKDSLVFEDILDLKLPPNGTYYKITWEKSKFENHISNYMLYDKKTFLELDDNFKLDEKWLGKQELDSLFKGYISDILICESQPNSCRYSVYIKDTNMYNEMPTDEGIYHVYAMMIDTNKHYIQVEEYKINYKK